MHVHELKNAFKHSLPVPPDLLFPFRQEEIRMPNSSNLFAVGAVLLGLSAGAATAQSGPESDSQNVVTNQLEAFIAGDYARAYSYASPDIKRIFPTLDQFMSMVQTGYVPVLRPGNYAFGRVQRLDDGRLVWEVLIRGQNGNDYTAAYYMEKQPDGSWKVDAVQMRKGAAGMT